MAVDDLDMNGSPSAQPTLFVLNRVLTMLDDPKSNLAKLADAIEYDDALFELVMSTAERLVGHRRRVRSCGHAIALLGRDRIAELFSESLWRGHSGLTPVSPTQSPAARTHGLERS